MFRDKDLAAWDISNIDRILEQGTNPRAPIEMVLRSLNTLRRCVETTSESPPKMELILKHPSIIPVLYFWLQNRVEPGASGARLKEHIIFIFINLLGFSPKYDELIVLDSRFLSDILSRFALDENSVVALAASQLVRRISELDHVSGVLCFGEDVLTSIVEALTVSVESREYQCATHYLSAFINLTANEKAHFGLARNAQFVEVLLAILRNATEGDRSDVLIGTLAAKSIANLLHFPENVPELSHKGLILVLAECVRRGEEIQDEDYATLGNVAAIALDYCHDKGVELLEVNMRAEMHQSPASLPRAALRK